MQHSVEEMLHTRSFNINEVYVVCSGMNHCPEGHRVCDLTVEPDILIGGEEPSQVRTNNPNDVAKHWKEDKTTIVCEDKTSPTRSPNRPCKTIECSQP